jgi:hypothetical protein
VLELKQVGFVQPTIFNCYFTDLSHQNNWTRESTGKVEEVGKWITYVLASLLTLTVVHDFVRRVEEKFIIISKQHNDRSLRENFKWCLSALDIADDYPARGGDLIHEAKDCAIDPTILNGKRQLAKKSEIFWRRIKQL